jgi:hypothetical protein
MLLHKGEWQGKGSVLFDGRSLGLPITADIKVTHEESAIVIEGTLSVVGHGIDELSARLVENDTGIYTLDVFHRGARLDGSGKFESEPNHALLWNEAGTIVTSVSLFPTSVAAGRGIGCRGFLRERGAVLTWEIAFTQAKAETSGRNVVSILRRRK